MEASISSREGLFNIFSRYDLFSALLTSTGIKAGFEYSTVYGHHSPLQVRMSYDPWSYTITSTGENGDPVGLAMKTMDLSEEDAIRFLENLMRYPGEYPDGLREASLLYRSSGLVTIPTRKDKSPLVKWKEFGKQGFQKDISQHFDHAGGIGIVCGAESGNIEVLDIDLKYDVSGRLWEKFQALVERLAPGLLDRLTMVRTINGGYHLLFRCRTKIEGNQKLAIRQPTNEEVSANIHDRGKVLLETRGEGGYIIAAPTRGYYLLRNTYTTISEISDLERGCLFSAARFFDESKTGFKKNQIDSTGDLNRGFGSITPWKDYDQRECGLPLLLRHGWTIIKEQSNKVTLKRPGNSTSPHSGYYFKDTKKLFVFSTSTPFESENSYQPSAIYTILEHHGDFREAANSLRQKGYWREPDKPVDQLEDCRGIENEHQVGEGSQWSQTPYLPERSVAHLPQLLRKGADFFSNNRSRDIYLTGALAVISGCLGNLKGQYGSKVYYPNLMTFVVAPPASGKGSIDFARLLGGPIHDEKRQRSRLALEAYEQEFAESKKNKEAIFALEKPKNEALFLPANSSSAALFANLAENKGEGIVFESEAETLIGTLGQDWGNSLDIFLKGFGHETLSLSRKTNNEFVEIKNPKISIVLAGVPDHFQHLFPSSNNGLYSRFLFYAFEEIGNWQNMDPSGFRSNPNELFRQLGDEIREINQRLCLYQPEFMLSPEQWSIFNKTFARHFEDLKQENPLTLSNVKRMGIMTFRLAMVLSALRNWERHKSFGQYLKCDDIDLSIAISFFETYLEHALFLFDYLPKQKKSAIQPLIQQWLNMLPNKFTRGEAIERGEALSFSESKTDRLLRKYQGELFKKISQGLYVKLT